MADNKRPFKGRKDSNRLPEYNIIKEEGRAKAETGATTSVRLNKYIADCGVCSRRDADELISSGQIKVNGKLVKGLGIKVGPNDKVFYKGKQLRKERYVYLLLNKPKDFITNTDDPQNRKTVMSLVENACEERVLPVGRLERSTSGLLIFTNDGELTARLSHPSNNIKKVYQVELNKPLEEEHFEAIKAGLELEDGKATVVDIAFLDDSGLHLGMEVHLGRHRIVRRIFEHLKYDVVKLDRVMYAGLTKKDIPRGKWRFLKEKELIQLKGIGKEKPAPNRKKGRKGQ